MFAKIEKLSTRAQLALLIICLLGIFVCIKILNTPDTIEPVAVTITATSTAMPSATKTPVPTATVFYPTPTLGATSTQDSYGFFRNCTPDPIIPNHCICEDFDYTVHIERDNCEEDLCSATITFTNDYGDNMWVDFFDSETSLKVSNGDTILLPSLNETNWSISSAIPFFEE